MTGHRDLWWPSPTVALGKTVEIPLSEPFHAEHGGELPSIQVCYESWGALNAARDNAVLVIHPMTADCHATGDFEGQEIGWWEPLIGPGRSIDTNDRFVVCPNLIGGCYGTTGPRFPAPDGAPWLDRFPLLTPRDMMRVQKLFCDALGIERLAMVIGPSMGGMIAWEWAIEHGDRVDEVVVVAAPLRTSPHQIGLNWLQRRGIELDFTENEVTAKWGQMVARGVGMLSYRSPTGLEEKFGREWFKKPGATLKDRGMFNVESWLRAHGQRITKRFDPYTYMLYSRAMDLHDVSEGRGDLVTALNRVACPVLVVGISSDYLYPPDEVHLGADVLSHLGRPVRYREIRSPHGHDAFLLETAQIDAVLREPAMPEPPAAAIRLERDLVRVRIGILGAGRVAAAFLRLLEDRREQLREHHGLDPYVQAVAEIDRLKVLDTAFAGTEILYDPEALVRREDLDVVLDLTRGPGTVDLLKHALARRRPVVTPKKALLKAHGEELERIALQHGVRLAYHDSIAAGWPLLYTLERPLAQSGISGIQAMLSASCNVILERMEAGTPFEEALADVVARELTEPDPDLDVSGWDSAQKLTILLAQASGLRYGARDVPTTGIRDLDPSLVREAPDLGYRVKLVSVARRDGRRLRATVRPMAVPRESHLGLVRGGNHVVVLQLTERGETVYVGSGSGDLPVATAVLNDLIGLFDPEHSWTGRFPRASEPAVEPGFSRWLVRESGRAEVRGGEPPTGSPVPVLDPAPLT